MITKKKKSPPISTFLGPDASIEGTIEFRGTIRLDGKVRGKIQGIDSTVIVGEKAVIDADIAVDTAIIMGVVTGTIEAREKIEVYPPGRVMGDICAPVIAIGSGASFNGNCGMRAREASGGAVSEGQKKHA
ncbi:MAG: polymer-forming cytoskeletal protein [Desulfococcaceae bacterium]